MYTYGYIRRHTSLSYLHNTDFIMASRIAATEQDLEKHAARASVNLGSGTRQHHRARKVAPSRASIQAPSTRGVPSACRHMPSLQESRTFPERKMSGKRSFSSYFSRERKHDMWKGTGGLGRCSHAGRRLLPLVKCTSLRNRTMSGLGLRVSYFRDSGFKVSRFRVDFGSKAY